VPTEEKKGGRFTSTKKSSCSQGGGGRQKKRGALFLGNWGRGVLKKVVIGARGEGGGIGAACSQRGEKKKGSNSIIMRGGDPHNDEGKRNLFREKNSYKEGRGGGKGGLPSFLGKTNLAQKKGGRKKPNSKAEESLCRLANGGRKKRTN